MFTVRGGDVQLGTDADVVDLLNELPWVNRSSSSEDIRVCGVAGRSHPSRPRKGRSITAFFQVISEASPITSSEVDLGVVAQAALHGAACAVVLDTVARKGSELTVVSLDGEIYQYLAARIDQHRPNAIVQTHYARGAVEANLCAESRRLNSVLMVRMVAS